MVTVLLRLAVRNLQGTQDLYMHTNTLAALANLAPYVANLNSHAVQRLFQLLNALHKRHLRLHAVLAVRLRHASQPFSKCESPLSTGTELLAKLSCGKGLNSIMAKHQPARICSPYEC